MSSKSQLIIKGARMHNLKNIDGEHVDLYEILKHSAGNYGIDDHNAVLKLK